MATHGLDIRNSARASRTQVNVRAQVKRKGSRIFGRDEREVVRGTWFGEIGSQSEVSPGQDATKQLLHLQLLRQLYQLQN